ncbi:MAG: 5'/3'-nucleotidase SurE [Candidatus Bipolaricaulia bacterium]
MRFLLTNDDGIDAPGLSALAEELAKLGEVLVVAPEREMSGSGHAFTKRFPLRLRRVYKDGQPFGYATSGTPADSVKLGLFLVEREVDWVVSGINNGPNLGIDLFYSGTVSGALEGAIDGFPAIAFSLAIQAGSGQRPDQSRARFVEAAAIARTLLEGLIERGPALARARVCLNVNIPDLPRERIVGVKLTAQGLQRYDDHFLRGEDPFGEPYYWLTGAIVDEDHREDSDLAASKEGWITLTPLRIDLTDHELLKEMRQWGLRLR